MWAAIGDVAALVVTAQVRGDALVLREDLNGGAREAHLDDLTGQLVGHGVVVTLDLDVVVNVDLGGSPGGELVTRREAGPAGPVGRALRRATRASPRAS